MIMLATILDVSTLLLVCFSSLAQSPSDIGQAISDDSTAGELSAQDWAGIRTAHEAERHVASPIEGGYQARNPGQRWKTTFNGRGFLIVPDSGGWTWGLELASYGFAGDERSVTEPMGLSAEGGRVACEWDATLEEWYVNDWRGLEHGYTIHRCPAHAGEVREKPLTFTLAVRGELQPKVAADGHDVRFLDGSGATVLTYAGLNVFDAEGRELPASFERLDDRLRLSIDERGARYPLTIDPLAQQAYLKASNTDGGDLFGYSVAVSGDTVVVGAIGESSSATGVNGNQSDNSTLHSGAAYVFVRVGTSWSQQAYLKASNTDGDDIFGRSVCISGDTVVVGAPQERSNATGVNGNQSDNSLEDAGAAYVFVRSGTTWSQQAYLKASNTDGAVLGYGGDKFGWSVSVSGDTLVVGAQGESSNATGVNGNQSDNSAAFSGATYVFVRSGTSWSQEAYLKASNTDHSDQFGWAVAACGDTIAIGAQNERSSATGVNGDENDDLYVSAGAAYVFVRNGTDWSQQAYLKASNTDSWDAFGFAVALSGDTVVVGSPGEGSGATGVNGDQDDNSSPVAGAGYVFVRAGTSWSQQAYLKSSNTDSDDNFGSAVALSGDTALVGSRGEDGSATGVNGNQADNSAPSAGAAFVFARIGATWSQQAYLKASNTDAGDWFSFSVGLAGDTAVVGARMEASSATGANGNERDNSAPYSGAAYVFTNLSPGTGYCSGDPGIGTPCPCSNDNDGSVPGSGCANGAFASGAQLTGNGTASVSADTLILACTGLHPNNTGLYFQANNRINGGDGNVFGDGLRCAGGGLMRLQVRTSDASGASSTTIPIGAKGGVSAGDTKRYQCWYRDTSGNPPCGVGVNDFNLSNGYEITWLP